MFHLLCCFRLGYTFKTIYSFSGELNNQLKYARIKYENAFSIIPLSENNWAHSNMPHKLI